MRVTSETVTYGLTNGWSRPLQVIPFCCLAIHNRWRSTFAHRPQSFPLLILDHGPNVTVQDDLPRETLVQDGLEFLPEGSVHAIRRFPRLVKSR